MNKKTDFSCFVIGEGTLPIKCAEILEGKGHKIQGIFSPNKVNKEWAKEKKIVYIKSLEQLKKILTEEKCDYIFSIVNYSFLPEEILALAQIGAINYHDSLLPKYAGINATSWAIINQEKQHGISWHLMTDKVDAGDILKQIIIDIEPEETALSLNSKCYEAAIASFTELVDELASQNFKASKQNLQQRSYFPRNKKLKAAGIIDFYSSAAEIDALVRGLDFGSFPNPLNSAKLALHEDFVIITSLEILQQKSSQLPGTIIAIAEDHLQIATSSQDIALKQVKSKQGQSLSITELVNYYQLEVGKQLPQIESTLTAQIEEIDSAIAKAENFWVKQLSQIQPLIIPYIQHKLSSSSQAQYEQIEIPISQKVINFLDKSSSDWQLGNFILAAFYIYLARLNSSQKITLGLNQLSWQSDWQDLETWFAPDVPLSLTIEYEENFTTVYSSIQKQLELTKQRQTYSTDIFARYPQLTATETEEPLFSAKVSWQDNLNPNQYQFLSKNSYLTLVISNQQQKCFWLYRAEAFNQATITRMLGQLTALMEGIVSDRNCSIGKFPLLSPEEKHQLLVEWKQTQAHYPQDKCIHQLFEAQVEQTPDAVAVVFENRKLTYRELNFRANQVARYLRSLGVEPEILVGICVERSIEMIVGILGILKAGGAYVPLDPAYPQERLAYILEDASVSILLTQEKLLAQLPQHQARVICLDRDEDIFARASQQNFVNEVAPFNLAYVIYTSGSTGKPKGVLVSHYNVGRLFAATQAWYNFDEKDVWTLFHSYAFDFSVWELWGALLYGGRLIIVPYWISRTPKAFYQLLAKEQVTVLNQTPSAFSQLIQVEEQLNTIPELSLRLVIFGGEALELQTLRPWFERHGDRFPQLVNMYGITETTVHVTYRPLTLADLDRHSSVIGCPIPDLHVYILDRYLQPVPIGIAGEMYIEGAGLARGYLNRPELTAERFISNPFTDSLDSRLYKSGDLARYLPNGDLEYLGRIDHQVKIRGFRIELGEIETAIASHSRVSQTAVIVREDQPGNKRIVAYIVSIQGQAPTTSELRSFLQEKLPDYMVPAAFVFLNSLPLTVNGKVDRLALPTPEAFRPRLESAYVTPQTKTEKLVTKIWQEVLQLEKVGIYDNFFELGGDSLLAIEIQNKLQSILEQELSIVNLFQYPTIYSLAQYLNQKQIPVQSVSQQAQIRKIPNSRKASIKQRRQLRQNDLEIAIIGMSGKFPGAKDIDEFWQNLRDGLESISFFSDRELAVSGIDSALLNNPNYVKANGFLPDVELFDASFFGFSPKEAEMMDPQHRLFLEVAWQALESAGYDPETYEGSIGVYAGTGMNNYLFNNLYPNGKYSSPFESASGFQLMIGNNQDFLPTRVSYKLNLKGPSVNVQTACSTSLVAVHLACQSLLNGECDMALAGGVSLPILQKTGYLHQEGMIFSPDGHCRAFDAQAQGTVFGSGTGVVILKLLSEAIADGDHIYAVIKGSAINNDGSLKAGYAAPSIDGQISVISEAQTLAGVEAETITYIEAHGTGTTLGDPIEITALTQAFRASTDKKGFCAIGTVKTNIGHLDVASGVVGLIKTALAIKHQTIPPSLNFDLPNPQIDFVNSPFYVNTTLQPWQTQDIPRRAGVSAFGIGGTNAHVVLEEAPPRERSDNSRPWQLLLVSAKTEAALEEATQNLAQYLDHHSKINLADVAYTLQVGRRAFNHRRMLVCQNLEEAAILLKNLDAPQIFTDLTETQQRNIIFMFSGQGAQYVNMGQELYQSESIFRERVDRCCELLNPKLGLDLRDLLYPSSDKTEEATQLLKQTWIAQPALFTIEYALACQWMAWGVHPRAMIGHSIGEYVAACLAGVFSLEDALMLVADRGRLMHELPQGAMLTVFLPEEELPSLLNNSLSLAVSNAPSLNVISGTVEAIDELEKQLLERGIDCRRLHTSHAFHSPMMEPILSTFTERVGQVTLNPPQIPYISNVSGTWITVEEATKPSYWAQHLRQPVLFATGIKELLQDRDCILLEVGPGQMLKSLALKQAAGNTVLSSVRHPKEQTSDVAFLLNTLGQLWLAGIEVDWSGFYQHELRYRLPLPTYPFQRQRYWIEAKKINLSVPLAEVGEPTEVNEKFLSSKIETQIEKTAKPSVGGADILQATASNRYTLLTAYLQELVAKTLGIKPSQLNLQKSLNYMGLDSLMAIELRNKIINDLKVDISMVKLMEGQSVASLAIDLDRQLTESESLVLNSVTTTSLAPPDRQMNLTKEAARLDVEQILTNLDRLSDEEVDRLLNTLSSEQNY